MSPGAANNGAIICNIPLPLVDERFLKRSSDVIETNIRLYWLCHPPKWAKV
jgi:hypothetical protein